MKNVLRGIAVLLPLLALRSATPANACYHSYCSITCYEWDGSHEYYFYDYTYAQCCSDPNVINACPGFQRVNYWFNGCTGNTMTCAVAE